ncbi:MAG: hypothetical protein JJU19_13245 [Pararhodobacter sp.]|nr:hypothetical protein [Pararhodobacter sp.]
MRQRLDTRDGRSCMIVMEWRAGPGRAMTSKHQISAEGSSGAPGVREGQA